MPSVATSIGRSGRLREMSASSRPSTSTVPASATSAGDGDLGGDLVVERRQGQRAVVVGLDQDAGEHRHRGAGGQAARHPGHRLGQDVALDAELHGLPPSSGARTSRLLVHTWIPVRGIGRARRRRRRRRGHDTSARPIVAVPDPVHPAGVPGGHPVRSVGRVVLGAESEFWGSRRSGRSCGSCGRRCVRAGRPRRSGLWTSGGRRGGQPRPAVDGRMAFTGAPPRRPDPSTSTRCSSTAVHRSCGQLGCGACDSW